MALVTISHTAAKGTLLEGISRGDGTYEVMCEVKKIAGQWRWARTLSTWVVRSSRDRQPNQWAIDVAAKALREAGFDVELRIDRTARPTATAEADRAARQADRVEALQDKASRKRARAAAAEATAQRAHEALPPGGEPIKIGHHSEGRHRRALQRAHDTAHRAVQAGRDADAAQVRADTAAVTTAHRYNPRTVANRIETLRAEQRADQRALDGHTRVITRGADGEILAADTTTPATGNHRERVIAAMAQRADEITYWEGVRAQQIAAGLTGGWGPDDITAGDFVQLGGTLWRQVTRVNNKTISVVNLPRARQGLHTIADRAIISRYPAADAKIVYHEITAVMTEPEARERFPQIFTEIAGETDSRPPRPKPRGGKIRLDYRRGPLADYWSWEHDGLEYTAAWPHPDGWYTSPLAPVADPTSVQVSARRRAPGRLRGEPVEVPVSQVIVPGPLWWPEQVHNQVRAFVQSGAYRADPSSSPVATAEH